MGMHVAPWQAEYRLLLPWTENQLRNIVHGLCKMSGKQLQAVSHLLSEEQIKEIKIAMDIPPTNQAGGWP